MAIVKQAGKAPPAPTPYRESSVERWKDLAAAVKAAPTTEEAWAMFGPGRPLKEGDTVTLTKVGSIFGPARSTKDRLAEISVEKAEPMNGVLAADAAIKKGRGLIDGLPADTPVPPAWVERLVELYTARLECRWKLDALEDERDVLLGRPVSWKDSGHRVLWRFSRESYDWDLSGETICSDETQLAMDDEAKLIDILAACVRRTFGGAT